MITNDFSTNEKGVNFLEYPEILIDYLNYAEVILGRSSSTVREYGYDISNFLAFLYSRKKNIAIENYNYRNFNNQILKETNLIDLHSYMAYLEKSCNNSARTRSRKASSIRSFYKYLVNIRQLMEINVAEKLEVPKISSRNPVYLTLEECRRLLETVELTSDTSLQVRDFAILTLFLNCGLRVSELASIDLDDIKTNQLRIIGKGDKERILHLNQACREALQNYLKVRDPKDPDDQALFLSNRRTRISTRAIQRRVDHYLRLAGFDTTIYSTHKLRHSAATLMYQHGQADIRVLQEILGHASVQTTQIYTHLDDKIIKDALDNNPLNQ